MSGKKGGENTSLGDRTGESQMPKSTGGVG